MLPKVLKNFNLVIQGLGYAGRIDELTLPKLALKTEDYQLGGLDIPIAMDLGMEKLECDLTLLEYDLEIIKTFGLSTSRLSAQNLTKLTIKGGLNDDSAVVVPVTIILNGFWSSLDFGTWKVGDKSTLKAKFTVRYYKLTLGEDDLIEIDVDNMTRKVGDNDQLASI